MNEIRAHSNTNPPPMKTREEALQEIRTQFENNTSEANRLIDALLDGWNAIDLLTCIFGVQVAQSYLHAGFALLKKVEGKA